MDYHQENDQNHSNLPSAITLEVVPIKQETVIISTEEARNNILMQESLESQDEQDVQGVHFLTDDESGVLVAKVENGENYEKKKNELLEYLTRHDGSVVCKLCGEVLASRTHWYRHKYKLHVNTYVNPIPLFKCTHCNAFFKSRKGYIGHVSSRHSENLDQNEELNISIKEEIVETSSESPKFNNNNGKKKENVKAADWEEQRVKEEKLVADIIDRVRKECEAQGAAVSRRGYSRRPTVMRSCN
ncbi:unnamed protein product [Brassicogethes aeneus]|uniref:C2H2-type domain-containing protein n=1 Tax=Brassicogethes aeneus TaxID=1431903 RepID=A0A9P0B904_BRAAE|nr:unnamed protein product [Brassicogethes aeneus]